KIESKFLRQYPEFLEFHGRKKGGTDEETQDAREERTPIELLEFAYAEINITLAQELLEQVRRSSPQFFERLVIDLLVKMGYGGNLKNPGEVTGKTGDGGIDGFINEDE